MTSQFDNAHPTATDREPDPTASAEASVSEQGPAGDEPELLEEYSVPSKPKIVAESELDESEAADQDAEAGS